MNRLHKHIFFAWLIFMMLSCNNRSDISNYYINPEKGLDNNTGTSPQKPFKSLARIKSLQLKPGDSILLFSGSKFNEHLFLSCKGSERKPIVLGKYGGNERPHILGNTSQPQAVYIYNSEHFVIRDLEISNSVSSPVDKIQGLLVEIHNYGTSKNITIDNIYVHDVKGTLKDPEKGSGGSIVVSNYRDNGTDSVSSNYDGLKIQNCLVKDSDFGGIGMWGNWERKRWNPNRNVVIRNNIIDGIAGHGIVPVACEAPLIENNVIKNSPQKAVDPDGIDGIWPWSCDNTVVQYNIVSDIKSQWDAYGFDADYNCSNTLFQYNLSFNNLGGFLLICNSGGWPKDWSVGNRGTMIRYNVSINDGLRDYIGKSSNRFFSPIIHCTGSIENSVIEKNLFYVKKKPAPLIDKTILHLDDWGDGYFPDSTFFRNNYIFTEERNLAVHPENSSNHYFENNKYIGELKTPENGFTRHNGNFDKSLWYDPTDENWNKLITFLKDKTVPLDGKNVPVLDLIGYK